MLKGVITISRPSGSGPERIEIEVQDKLSGVKFFEATIGLADFTRALTARGDVPIRFNFRPKLVGLKREHKTEIVFVPDGKFMNAEVRGRKAVQPYFVDGWTGDWKDTQNGHNRNDHGVAGKYPDGTVGPGSTYRVKFVRWVRKDGTPA